VLLVCGNEILLVERCAYGVFLQLGGHLEPADDSLAEVAERELALPSLRLAGSMA
jgi:hypothetical protein